jgi:hypothetical protein
MTIIQRVANAIGNLARFVELLYRNNQINHSDLINYLSKMEYRIMSANQDKINALAAQLDKVSVEIKEEIQALKDQAANGETLDFSPLESRVQGLDDLNKDAQTPSEPAPSEPQPEQPAPVEPTPEEPSAPVDPSAPVEVPAPEQSF